jgi:hypothetical protein
MSIAELLIKAWPIFLGLITLIIVLAKLDSAGRRAGRENQNLV